MGSTSRRTAPDLATAVAAGLPAPPPRDAAPRTAPGDSADARLIASLFDALPCPAALVVDRQGRLAIHAANADFSAQASVVDIDAPDSPIGGICRSVIDGAAERLTRGWEQAGPTGRFFDATASGITVSLADGTLAMADGPVRCALLTLADRTTLIRTEANLRRELLSDSLTGLPNRSGLTDIIEQRLSGRGEGLALLIVDLLRFSRINESIGALAGDELLLTVARRLRHRMRGNDVLARIGADEFGLLCATDGSEQAAALLATRVAQCFEEPFRIGALQINVDCAIGGTANIRSANGADGTDLIRQTQIALKQAKSGGATAFYRPEALAEAHHRFDRETALRIAILRGDIALVFQPLVDMRRRRITGFEALARWTHDGTPVTPGEFVPIAEDSGLIIPLGRQIMSKALETLAAWDARAGGPIPLEMSVNLSPIQLARDDVVTMIAGLLESHGIAGHRLMVEVTEGCVVANPDQAGAILRALSALDVQIAMDDFGTGYSNIASLQRLPIDTLKIDRSLVAGIDNSADLLAVVRTIQRLGEALGMRTTAEGIETDAVAQRIAAIGCDSGQGYLFSRPLDADAAFAAWQASVRREGSDTN